MARTTKVSLTPQNKHRSAQPAAPPMLSQTQARCCAAEPPHSGRGGWPAVRSHSRPAGSHTGSVPEASACMGRTYVRARVRARTIHTYVRARVAAGSPRPRFKTDCAVALRCVRHSSHHTSTHCSQALTLKRFKTSDRTNVTYNYFKARTKR